MRVVGKRVRVIKRWAVEGERGGIRIYVYEMKKNGGFWTGLEG